MSESPCLRCPYRCLDANVCCFEIIMGIPWSESVDFEDRLPDECVMIEHYESLIEDLVDSKMIEDYHCLIEKIKGAIK